jgi:hypothetical protein
MISRNVMAGTYVEGYIVSFTKMSFVHYGEVGRWVVGGVGERETERVWLGLWFMIRPLCLSLVVG